jgi:hypothetical protein
LPRRGMRVTSASSICTTAELTGYLVVREVFRQWNRARRNFRVQWCTRSRTGLAGARPSWTRASSQEPPSGPRGRRKAPTPLLGARRGVRDISGSHLNFERSKPSHIKAIRPAGTAMSHFGIDRANPLWCRPFPRTMCQVVAISGQTGSSPGHIRDCRSCPRPRRRSGRPNTRGGNAAVGLRRTSIVGRGAARHRDRLVRGISTIRRPGSLISPEGMRTRLICRFCAGTQLAAALPPRVWRISWPATD